MNRGLDTGLFFLQMTGQDLKSVRIAGKAFTCDAREARHSGIGYLPKVLTLLNGGDVNLNRGDGDCFEGVEDRYARVRVWQRD